MIEDIVSKAEELLELTSKIRKLEAKSRLLRDALLLLMFSSGVPKISTLRGEVYLSKVPPNFRCNDVDTFLQRLGSKSKEYIEISSLRTLAKKDPGLFLSLFEEGVIVETSESTWKLVTRLSSDSDRKAGDEEGVE